MAPRSATSDLGTTLAGNIKAARDASGKTQRALAIEIEADQMALSRWERGVNRPSDENLVRLAEALGVTVAWLYTEREAAA